MDNEFNENVQTLMTKFTDSPELKWQADRSVPFKVVLLQEIEAFIEKYIIGKR